MVKSEFFCLVPWQWTCIFTEQSMGRGVSLLSVDTFTMCNAHAKFRLNSGKRSVRLRHICYQEKWPKHHSFHEIVTNFVHLSSNILLSTFEIDHDQWNTPSLSHLCHLTPWFSYNFCIFKEHTRANRNWFFPEERWSARNARRRGSWERWSTRTRGKQAAPTTQLPGQLEGVER